MTNYEKAIDILLSYYDGLNYSRVVVYDCSEVFVIEDSLLLYVELVSNNDPYNTGVQLCDGYHTLYIQELTSNGIIKFNKTEYDRKIEDLKFMTYYVRFHGLNSYSYPEQKETIEKVNKLKPELKLIERYNQWSGDFFNIIIFQMNSITNTKEYAIYVTTKKPNMAVQKIAHELLEKHKSQLVSNGFSVESYYFYMRGHYCKSFDFLDAYYSHKNVRNKKKLEENLKYYYTTGYFKELNDLRNYCNNLLEHLYNNNSSSIEWTGYIYPTTRWKTEEIITKTISKYYKDYIVIPQHRPFWLKSSFGGQMSYDIYISELKIAIEYQGEQHFKPVDYFGGEESFKKVQIRDKEKQQLSKEKGIKLIYINYWENVTESLIKDKIDKAINEK